jgi:GNAT superfamily N-acetyltransferase
MPYEIREVGSDSLNLFAEVPIAFTVDSILQVEMTDEGMGGFRLIERDVETKYVKDYDVQDDMDGPAEWPDHFDVSNWGFFLALNEAEPVGAAAVAFDTPGLNMLENRSDLAVIWDIRVHPDFRGRGIGSVLFKQAAEWSRERGCTQLKIETQNVNVPACRFYAKQGCVLGAIHRFAYTASPAVAHETMLLWYLVL